MKGTLSSCLSAGMWNPLNPTYMIHSQHIHVHVHVHVYIYMYMYMYIYSTCTWTLYMYIVHIHIHILGDCLTLLASGSDPTCRVILSKFKKHTLAKSITVSEGLTSRDSCRMQLQGCVCTSYINCQRHGVGCVCQLKSCGHQASLLGYIRKSYHVLSIQK